MSGTRNIATRPMLFLPSAGATSLSVASCPRSRPDTWASCTWRCDGRESSLPRRRSGCGSRPWLAEHVGGGVERVHRRRDAGVAGGLHQHLDQLLARDAEIQRAGKMPPELVRPPEGGQLGHRAEAPAAEIE